MNKPTPLKFSTFDSTLTPRFITQDEAKKMSKYRVIQKNLVHVQGFPDSVLNLLDSYELFGQFGKIIKLVIVRGKDEDNQQGHPQQSPIKKSNSAYITYSTNEEASHAVLAVDSFYYENHLIRAFFGTSKYCIHFLNNKECYNKDKCMYLHALASETDVLGNTCGIYSKFDYTEHLQMALSISGVLTKEKRERISKLKLPQCTLFPNIKTIYSKEFVLQAEKRLQEISKPQSLTFSMLSTASTNTPANHCHRNRGGKGSGRNSTNDEDASSSSKSSGKFSSDNSDQEYAIYRYKTQSRFFNDGCNYNEYAMNDSALVPFYLIELVDKALSRYAFFNKISSKSKDNDHNNNDFNLFQRQDHLLYDSWSDLNNSNNKLI